MHRGGFGGGGRDYSGGGGGGSFSDKVAPVKAGEEVDVVIEAVGAKGDGIAKKEGFVIFVPSASQGSSVRIRITKVLSNVAFAEVVGPATGAPSASKKKETRVQESSDSGSEPAETVDQPVDTENFGEES